MVQHCFIISRSVLADIDFLALQQQVFKGPEGRFFVVFGIRPALLAGRRKGALPPAAAVREGPSERFPAGAVSPWWGPDEAARARGPEPAADRAMAAPGTGWGTAGRADAAGWDPAMWAPGRVRAETAQVRALAGWSWNFPSHDGRITHRADVPWTDQPTLAPRLQPPSPPPLPYQIWLL